MGKDCAWGESGGISGNTLEVGGNGELDRLVDSLVWCSLWIELPETMGMPLALA